MPRTATWPRLSFPGPFCYNRGMNMSLRPAACALLLAFAACARQADIRNEPPWAPLPAAAESPSVFQTGVASWYGDDFNGKATADGEIYDMRKLTAAHQDLPFHTLVEVENLENNKKVLVRINDRGPFLKDRIIDLSWQAAQRLEMTEKGTAEVQLRVWRRGGTAPAGEAAPDGNRECFVQAGAFSVRENAEDLLLTLNEIFPELRFRVALEDGMFKVISPGLTAPLSCLEVLKKMAAFHLQGFARATDAPLEK